VEGLGFWSIPTGGISVAADETARPTVAPAPPEAASDPVEPPTLSVDVTEPVATTASFSGLTIRDNAFGIAVRRVHNLTIEDTTVDGSLIDGIVLEQEVVDATITATSSTDNGVDGFVISDGSTGVSLDGVAADRNGRNGITLDGTPRAAAPNTSEALSESASASAIVTGATASGNARYGIEIVGGSAVTVSGAEISGGQMGVVVRDAASGVTISDCSIADVARHAISVRDDPEDVEIRDNDLGHSETAVYVRNAQADVIDNRIEDADLHGVSAVGDLDGSRITGNEISGTGPAAIDVDNALQIRVERNLVDGWVASRSIAQILSGILQPLTIVWAAVLLLVVIALTRRFGARRPRPDDGVPGRAPLQSYSSGVVDRAAAERFGS
jgi:hypothetical protein